MKKLLLLLFLLISSAAMSQDSTLFDYEWHDKLNSDLEFISFPNPSKGDISVRVYRGSAEEHVLTVSSPTGVVVYSEVFSQECDFKMSNLDSGMYLLTVSNDKKRLTQTIFIGVESF